MYRYNLQRSHSEISCFVGCFIVCGETFLYGHLTLLSSRTKELEVGIPKRRSTYIYSSSHMAISRDDHVTSRLGLRHSGGVLPKKISDYTKLPSVVSRDAIFGIIQSKTTNKPSKSTILIFLLLAGLKRSKYIGFPASKIGHGRRAATTRAITSRTLRLHCGPRLDGGGGDRGDYHYRYQQ
jgi:hypothetical protein